MNNFVLGSLTAFGLAVFVFFSSAMLGVLPVQADSVLESVLLGAALRASVARHAPRRDNPLPPSEQNLVAGARIYRQMCSRCHGASKESSSVYGNSFYPPAPHLPNSRTSYTESEMFWIVKHGIRNTAMPAWGNLLSDDDIWQVVAVVRRFDSLPDSAKSELIGHHH